MSRVFIGLGSNLGDRLHHLSTAVRLLGTIPGIRVRELAPIIETKPVGGPAQDPYLNTVVELDTDLEPLALLDRCQAIERQLGRLPSAQRWVARSIDLDLLLYADQVIAGPRLAIPHPRLHERWFVLEPLAQLAPQLLHPTLHRTMAELLTTVAPAPARPAT
ncbi:MAG: 2-amino-4-hydroxy-6-hydroxymethyldihydropteridine diphosphokinase [Candidatus Omnitrophica bacterium]|nr:2-amino-4-hydroxy-6-hydroxymethyldihydropteridine diphosphokinase [Candidatus Omnitrophota bacterium]